MPLWGVHIGIAVIVTTVAVGALGISEFSRWLLIGINGVWSTVPDWWWLFTDRFVPALQVPRFAWAYRVVFHDSLLANLFWFHGVIDTVGSDDEFSSILVGASSVVVFLTVEYYLWSGHAGSDRVSEPAR